MHKNDGAGGEEHTQKRRVDKAEQIKGCNGIDARERQNAIMKREKKMWMVKN